MLTMLVDRSFSSNLVGLLIAAMLLMVVSLTSNPVRSVGSTTMTTQEMAMVQGNGRLGTALLVIGLTVAILGVAAVATGGVVIIALAAANVTYGAATAAMVLNVGLYAAGGGAATAAIGKTINWVETQ